MTKPSFRPKSPLARLATCALFLTVLLFTACQKQESIEPTFSSIWEHRLSKSCANCHQPGAQADQANVHIDFRDKLAAYNGLLASYVKGLTGSTTCNSVKLVTGGFPEQSYLVGILVSAYNKNNFAGQIGCQPINDHIEGQYASPAEQEAILNWILSGAPYN